MTVSEIFYEEVRKAMTAAKAAQHKFDSDKSEVTRLGSTSFSLFDSESGRIMNEFAKKLKNSSDDYFTSMQALVINLDSVCRPLLSDFPEKEAVVKVYEAIKTLNKDSEIVINVSATFEGEDLGGVVNKSYTVPIESKMIEKMWLIETNSDKYPSINGNPQAIPSNLSNEDLEKYNNTLKIVQEKKEEYDKIKAQKDLEDKLRKEKEESEKKSALENRKRFITENTIKAEEKYCKDLEALKNEYEKSKSVLDEKIKQNNSLIKSKNDELQALGLFAILKKNNCKKEIADAETDIQEINSQISALKAQHSEKCKELENKKDDVIESLEFEAVKKYRLPDEKGLSDAELRMSPIQRENEKIKKAILNICAISGGITIQDLTEELKSDFPDVSINKVNALTRQLRLDGQITNSSSGLNSFFKLA